MAFSVYHQTRARKRSAGWQISMAVETSWSMASPSWSTPTTVSTVGRPVFSQTGQCWLASMYSWGPCAWTQSQRSPSWISSWFNHDIYLLLFGIDPHLLMFPSWLSQNAFALCLESDGAHPLFLNRPCADLT